jgi:hypothetical protein
METSDLLDPKDKSKDSGAGARWWDQYYVRYFVGTVLGVAIIFVLREKAALHRDFEKIVPPLKDVTGWQLSALISVGLAYCYVASAPVLTLHAIRGGLGMKTPKCPIFLGLFLAAFAGVPLLVWGMSRWFASGSALGVALATVIVLAQIIAVAIAQGKDFKNIEIFYDGLVKARYEAKKEGTDYPDSYRHMREHGNAMLIVILEILLGAILATIDSPTAFVIVLIGWLIPAAYVWVIGSMLEGYFITIGGKVFSTGSASSGNASSGNASSVNASPGNGP